MSKQLDIRIQDMLYNIRRNLKNPEVKRIKDPALRLSVAKYYDCLKRLASE